MTTKPKARKFRIKRSPSAETEGAIPPSEAPKPAAPRPRPPEQQTASAAQTAPRQPSPPQQPQAAAQSGEVASAAQVTGEQDMDAIRQEGLTGRQLRMARRVAQKHGLPATSDFDAVRLLRAKGIDPFQRSNMLELGLVEIHRELMIAAAR